MRGRRRFPQKSTGYPLSTCLNDSSQRSLKSCVYFRHVLFILRGAFLHSCVLLNYWKTFPYELNALLTIYVRWIVPLATEVQQQVFSDSSEAAGLACSFLPQLHYHADHFHYSVTDPQVVLPSRRYLCSNVICRLMVCADAESATESVKVRQANRSIKCQT